MRCKILVCAIFWLHINGVTCFGDISWDSQIQPNPRELILQETWPKNLTEFCLSTSRYELKQLLKLQQDALTQYFGKSKHDTRLFPTWEEMEKKVGKYEDVSETKFYNHDYANMTAWIKELALTYPSITHLYSAGKSVQGRELWVLIISDNPKEHELLEPEVKYVGNMHGNEVVGRETLLFLSELLCKNYGKNDYLTSIVNGTRLHLLFSMNPDGYELGFPGDRVGYMGRANVHEVDLNRNFPAIYPAHKEASGGESPEQETKVVMKWMRQYPFVLSANLHGGSLVANYPYDDSLTGKDGEYTASPDDRLFVEMAYRYAKAHSRMWKTGRRCGLSADGDTFINGITNGAGWYHLAGGMQDWQYEHTNSLEITIEMGCYKFPTNDMIPKLWKEHKYSLLAFLEMAHIGVHGLVTDAAGKAVSNATVSVESGKTMHTTEKGEYWRILPPGKHTITIDGGKSLQQETYDIEDLHHNRILLSYNRSGGFNIRTRTLKLSDLPDVHFAFLENDWLFSSDSVLRELARLSCSDEFELDEEARLLILPSLNASTSQSLRDFNPSALLVVSEGVVEALTFSTLETQPRGFDQKKLEESLNKALGLGTGCGKPLREEAVALSVDDLHLASAFELGIAVGCGDASNVSRRAATVGSVVNVLSKALRLDAVQEFSVVPSANPADHFTPEQTVLVTSATIPHLAEEKCLSEVSNFKGLKMYRMGSGLPPYSLVVAIEKHTEPLVYSMMSRWCDNATQEGVTSLLAQSTVVFIPEIPNTQTNCHDYGIITPFQFLLADALRIESRIDFVLLFGTGGIKVRYINDTLGMADRAAQVYKASHPHMQDSETDVCSGGLPNERSTIGQFSWSGPSAGEEPAPNGMSSFGQNPGGPQSPPNVEWARPDTVLVQTACCHESGRGHLYEENRRSIIDMMKERIHGLRFSTDSTGVELHGKNEKKWLVDPKSKTVFVALQNGDHRIEVIHDGHRINVLNINISEDVPVQDRFISAGGRFFSSNGLIIVSITFLICIALFFCCKQRLSLHRRSFLTGKAGFERVPLYKSDDEDEDDLFDLQKL